MIKGVFAVLLSLAMSLSLLGDSVLAIDHEILLKRNGITDQTCIYECDDVSITFSVTEKWENGYTAQVRVSNLTTECLDNWHLEMLTTDDIKELVQ